MGEQKRRYDARNGVSRTMILDDDSDVFHVEHQSGRRADSRLDQARSGDHAAERA